ncbi:MAG TPA: hypothetical protein VN922_22950, partial [Bacteroidia bacterium]|nr:hypothetical protein [Bacteroidia bacterium]
MNKKQHLIFKGWTSIAAICFFIAVLIFEKVEMYGYALGILFIGYFAYKAYKDFKQSATVTDNEPLIGLAPDASDVQKIKFHKKILTLGFVAFPILTAIIIYDLNGLESGSGQSFGDLAP